MKLKGKIICVFGLPNTGKTNFIRWLTQRPPYRRHLIFDPVKDYPTDSYGLVYRPNSRKHSSEGGSCDDELNEVIDETVNRMPAEYRPKFVVVDEANRSLKNIKGGIPSAARDLIDFNTHYSPQVTLICACRRPAKLHTDVKEIASHYFVLSSGGKNDESSYNDLASDATEYLDSKEPYEILHIGPNRNCQLFSPVKDMGEKGRI